MPRSTCSTVLPPTSMAPTSGSEICPRELTRTLRESSEPNTLICSRSCGPMRYSAWVESGRSPPALSGRAKPPLAPATSGTGWLALGRGAEAQPAHSSTSPASSSNTVVRIAARRRRRHRVGLSPNQRCQREGGGSAAPAPGTGLRPGSVSDHTLGPLRHQRLASAPRAAPQARAPPPGRPLATPWASVARICTQPSSSRRSAQ